MIRPEPATVAMLRARWDEVRDEVLALSAFIHEHVETAGDEVACSTRIVEVLESAGLRVDTGLAGLPTAFAAQAGPPCGPTVAFLCEYDGLPPYGQSCGHNVVSAASVGAGLILAPLAERTGLRVMVVGTPAEEGFGAKRDLADAGVFAGVDACLLIYPGMDDIAVSRTLCAQGLTVTMVGRAAHAAAHPELGASALDALVAGYVGISMLRHTAPPEARVHAVITEGGRYPQVIPDRAQARVVVRAGTEATLSRLLDRVVACFEGAASAHGVRADVELAPRPALDVLENRVLGRTFEDALLRLGRTPCPTDRCSGAWSTDAGYLSRVVPVLQPQIRVTDRSVSPHSHEFHEASIGPEADSAIETAALALALTAVAVAGDPALRGRIKAEFVRARRSREVVDTA